MRFNLLLLTLIPLFLHALPGFSPPWGKDEDLHFPQQPSPPPLVASSPAARTTYALIAFHQKTLSPVDGPRSHFYPCSSYYMKFAIQKYGFFTGFCMGCDRLLRENEDPWVYKTIEVGGKLLKYDPVK